MSFNLSMLNHMRAISECLPRFGARAELKFDSFQIEVRSRGLYYDLIPQYAVLSKGKLVYTPYLTSNVTSFIGWRHYFNRQWELSTQKLAFKRYCLANGVRTPALFSAPEEVTTDVIIKRTRSSFGEGISGPFSAADARALNRPLETGEYYDQFINGDIAKIWYWEDKPVCLEIKPMVYVTGVGEQTLRDLITEIRSSFVPVEWGSVEALARYQGLSLDSVVVEGQRVLVDFRWLSSLHPSHLNNSNVLPTFQGSAREQMERAGSIFWAGIPKGIGSKILYTIDAVIDPNQNVWFLEMNSNPVVHPDAYAAMFEGLFGPPEAVARPAGVPGARSPDPVIVHPSLMPARQVP